MAGVQGHTQLEHIYVRGARIDVAGTQALASALLQCSSLVSLDLKECVGIGGATMAELVRSHGSLKCLDMAAVICTARRMRR